MDHIEPKKHSTFGCNKEERAKLCYHGQEKHFYGVDTPGPGSYVSNGDRVGKHKGFLLFIVSLSSYKNANHFSVPKGDRGLLYLRKDDSVNPFSYPNPNEIYVKAVAKKDGAYSMPKS